jgi:predicted CoA-binding protein
MKKTLVLGASLHPSRYSNLAIHRLIAAGHSVVAIGLQEGEIAGVQITSEKKDFENIHTITLYLSATNQLEYYDYILSLHPKRVIFNPGAENESFFRVLQENNIEAEAACTLVLLGTNQY